jgi:hypothetical protein
MDFLHQSLLALWGCPIGEMWDLEKLAEKCRERGRWTFFMTSAPANMPGKEIDSSSVFDRKLIINGSLGGVGSHANATAIL